MTNSCRDCPNRVDASDSEKKWGHDFGVDTCSTYGYLLGQPGEGAEDTAVTMEAFGGDCLRYGTSHPDVSNPQRKVFTGNETITADLMSHLTPDRPTVSRCSGCANYITAGAVRNRFGWNAGACAMYGALLGGNQAMTMPSICAGHANKEWVTESSVPIKIRGGSPDPFEGLELREAYSDNAVPLVVRTTSTLGTSSTPRPKKTSLDPRSGPFHRESTSDEKMFGILGYNQLTHEDAKRPLEYPVFAEWLFGGDVDEIAKIPTSTDSTGIHLYEDYDGAIFQLYSAMRLGDTPVFMGEAGTGKTEAYRFLAYLMGVPFDRISIGKATEADDLTGFMVLKDNEMEWIYGRLSKRLGRVGVCLVDEPNMGMNEVWELLRPLLDAARQIVLDKKDGEVIHKFKHCYFGMAMNPSHDPRYIGAQEISVADQSRLTTIASGHPPATVEKRILRNRCKLGDADLGIDGFTLDKDELTSIMKISEGIRAACDRNAGGELEYGWSVRSNLKVALLSDVYNLEHCYRLVATNALDPEQAAIINALVKGVLV